MNDGIAEFLAARLDEDEAMVAVPHIWPTTFQPARVFREVAAKRAILARYGVPPEDADLGEHLQHSQEQAGLRFALRVLAVVYSDNPDYRKEWAAD